jgi:hypothetical protein
MKSGRYYNCINCQTQVVICSKCDHGNIYCGPICANEARTKNHRAANKKYQATTKGRRKHALRQKRYRERQKQKVTDEGSLLLPAYDVLPREPNEPKPRQKENYPRCYFCGATVIYLRHGFLRYDIDAQHPQKSASWPLGP